MFLYYIRQNIQMYDIWIFEELNIYEKILCGLITFIFWYLLAIQIVHRQTIMLMQQQDLKSN